MRDPSTVNTFINVTQSSQTCCEPLSYYKLGSTGISEENGFWRTFSFGMLAMEKVRSYIISYCSVECSIQSAYDKTSKFDLSIEGWGGEDLRFYETCVKYEVNDHGHTWYKIIRFIVYLSWKSIAATKLDLNIHGTTNTVLKMN